MANELLPVWNEIGVEPPQSLKDSGWQPGMKPSAQHMNWLFNRIYKCLEEIQAGGGTGELEQELAALQQTLATHLADYVKHPGVATTTNSGNAYSVVLSPAPIAYQNGMGLILTINADSTADSTINVNGLGEVPIKKANGTLVTNLKANGVYTLRYNSSAFILQGEGGSGNASASDLLSGKTASTDAGDIVGTMLNNGAGGTVTPGTKNQSKSAGYYSSPISILGDADLIAANIRKDIDIFGVLGTLDVASLGGKRYATGTVSTVSGTYHTVEVTGLAFIPRIIVVTAIDNSTSPIGAAGAGYDRDLHPNNYLQYNSGTAWYRKFTDIPQTGNYVNDSGFRFLIGRAAQMKWTAYE